MSRKSVSQLVQSLNEDIKQYLRGISDAETLYTGYFNAGIATIPTSQLVEGIPPTKLLDFMNSALVNLQTQLNENGNPQVIHNPAFAALMRYAYDVTKLYTQSGGSEELSTKISRNVTTGERSNTSQKPPVVKEAPKETKIVPMEIASTSAEKPGVKQSQAGSSQKKQTPVVKAQPKQKPTKGKQKKDAPSAPTQVKADPPSPKQLLEVYQALSVHSKSREPKFPHLCKLETCVSCRSIFTTMRLSPCVAHNCDKQHLHGWFMHIGPALTDMLRSRHNRGHIFTSPTHTLKANELWSLEEFERFNREASERQLSNPSKRVRTASDSDMSSISIIGSTSSWAEQMEDPDWEQRMRELAVSAAVPQ